MAGRRFISNTTGANNTAANGRESLYSNTTGSNNVMLTAIQALYSNTTGANNTANGYQALFSNTTAGSNVANGLQALYSNTTGVANVANGVQALFSNTTGNYNVATGYLALYSNTTGSNNTVNGKDALYSNTTGASNTASGYYALRSNTTGAQNVAVSQQALFSNTTGNNNTANGFQALYSNTTASNSTAIGKDALRLSTTGGNNTAVGYQAGEEITTGAKNTILGSYNGNQGGLDIRTASNHIVLSDGDGNPRAYWDAAGAATFGGAVTANSGITLPNTQTLNWKDSGGVIRQILQYFSDNNLYIDAPNGSHVFRNGAGNTEKFRIDLTGAATFGGAVDIGGAISINGDETVGNDGVSSYWKATSGTHYFQTGGATKMTLDSSGNLTTTGAATFATGLNITGNGGFFNAANKFGQDQNGGAARMYSSGGNTTTKGSFEWHNTSSDGSADTIGMVLNASGNLLVGGTVANGKVAISHNFNTNQGLYINGTTTGDTAAPPAEIVKYDNNSTTSQLLFRWSINQGAAGQGMITANGAGLAAFASYSDSRLKENIADLPDQYNNIRALRPVEFDYIESEGGGHQVGFIAQEMQEVYPCCVGERPDGMLQVAGWSKTEARLVSALQSAMNKIDELTARIEALEGAK
jgi:hypothetical protein